MSGRQQRVDWSALTHAEQGWLREVVRASVNGQPVPPAVIQAYAEQHRAWQALSAQEREQVTKAEVVELQRVGAVRADGKWSRGDESLTEQVKTVLSTPGNERVMVTVNEQTGKVSSAVLALPVPYFQK